MTVADILNVLTSKVNVSIVNNGTDTEVMNVKNTEGLATNLATEVSGATVRRMTVDSASSVSIVIEGA